MRIPFVAGNWKMNRTSAEARELVSQLIGPLREISRVEKVVCPPFTALAAVGPVLEGTGIGLGAQNIHWEEKGAFTGEVSAAMVREFCTYVILGHSERRGFFSETDEMVNRKLQAAEQHGLIPIVCVGETLEEFESNRTSEVVGRQTENSLQGISPDDARKLIVAYEPVWAIGTGRASTAVNAASVIREVIRPAISKLYGKETAQAVRVLYGGSVTASNAAEFFSVEEIDGGLVGGASLKPEEFVAIVRGAEGV
ncbi:MAG: triose-phosphate isomerase [Chloroflexi bacterium]|nr:triose-phosphate isomerase [Chloroflexota bacterium]